MSVNACMEAAAEHGQRQRAIGVMTVNHPLQHSLGRPASPTFTLTAIIETDGNKGHMTIGTCLQMMDAAQ